MKIINLRPPNIIQPVFSLKSNVFKRKPIILLDKVSRWRKCADLVNLSDKARLRLEWIIFYETIGNHKAYLTAEHFSVSPKTFYKWFNRFNNGKVLMLEDQSKTPQNKRNWEVSFEQECRIKRLRKKHLHYGKKKIQRLYQRQYQESISVWKIQRVINKHNLYPDKKEIIKIRKKIKSARQKHRIQNLTIIEKHWFLFHLDTIVIYYGSIKRYILAAIDHHGKIAYARMYQNKSSRSAKDFLFRLNYLINAQIANVQTDNGSEFYKEFEQALDTLEIKHWFSRVKTPQDNSIVEKFNQTLEYEWLYDGNFTPNLNQFNKNLTEWLKEYNFKRPHQALDYLTPFEYYENTRKTNEFLLPMYPASAKT